MMAQQINQEKNRIDKTNKSCIGEKIDELSKSVNNVYKYELLTTNQYLQQMELVLEIFNELSDVLDN
jgi:hypothetical protein